MKIKLKMDVPTDIDKPTIDDMKFLSKDGTTEINFDEWFDEFIGDTDIIQKLKNNKMKLF